MSKILQKQDTQAIQSEPVLPNPQEIVPDQDYVGEVRNRMKRRFWRCLDMATHYATFLVFYSLAIVSDFLVFALIFWSIGGLSSYPKIELCLNAVRILIAGLTAVGGIVHALVSTFSLMKQDVNMSKEGDQL